MAKNQGGAKQSKAEKLRVLFGKGILKSKGKRGKDGKREVTYHPEAGKTSQARGRRSVVQRLRKSGAVGKVSMRYRNTPGKSGRHVFGAKAAHLRGSGTGGKKVDHSATRAARLAAGNKTAQEFLSSSHGREAVRLNNRAADHLERRGMRDPGARDINKMRVRQQKAERTLGQVLKSQKYTYNGWKANGYTGTWMKKAQTERYARLKRLERKLRDTYGL